MEKGMPLAASLSSTEGVEYNVRRTRPITVLIVDDSALVRSILSHVLSAETDIVVVGGAGNPYEARELIIEHRPDVIILDIEMPRMDGLTFLRKLQVHYPVPVIMCSGVAPANSSTALEAIESGAIDVVAKPTSGGSASLRRLGEDLADKIRAAAIAMPAKPSIPASVAAAPTSARALGIDPEQYLVAIGASTGGTEAIKELLSRVPADFPPVVMVQHMPEGFTNMFAQRVNQLSAMSVSEATDGETLAAGKALLARGGRQMRVRRNGARWTVHYGRDDPVNRHCPSVDVLFDSVAEKAGRHAVGVILTGMGNDGAHGLLRLRENGAATFAQDRNSCVVYGMPKVAAELGAADEIASPGEIPRLILNALRKRRGAGAMRVGAGETPHR